MENSFSILLVDKPKELTSFDVVHSIRKITNVKKVGHCGTLDKFATGLLVILVGKATRIANFITIQKKEYLVTMQFGIKTDTLDITGKIIQKSEKKIELPSNLTKLVLAIKDQIPPKYSALKVNGKRAYKLARENINFTLKKREIKIYDFKIVEYIYPFMKYTAVVSKGTYIRTLTEDIAKLSKGIATTTELRRIKSGNLSIENAVNLNKLSNKNWKNYGIPIYKILPEFPIIELDNNQSKTILNGGFVKKTCLPDKGLSILSCNKNIIGIAKMENGFVYPQINFF